MSKFVVFVLLFSSLIFINSETNEPSSYDATIEQEIKDNILVENKYLEPTFTSSKIPDNIYSRMIGASIPIEYKYKIDMNNLSYLQISYFGFDGKTYVGEMIVNSKLANEVLEIFKDLYNIQYPIEKIRLIDEYNANDELSMSDNNTSCFCYRVIEGSSKLSNHSIGTAIDVNPLYNPYVSSKSVSPASASIYANRNSNFEHQIKKNDEIYNIFVSRGWSWGGDWKSPKDYQHFEKNI